MGGDPQADEATLLQAARAGDPTAFPALFERWFEPTRDLAASVLSNRDDIFGAVVAGFRRAWAILPDIGTESFGAAVGLATRSAALGRLDKGAAAVEPVIRTSWFRTRPGATPEDRLAASSAADDAASDADIAELVRAASLVLAPADRSLLVLHLRLGVTEQEIAASTGDEVHDVEQRLFRLRARLRVVVEAIVLWRGGRPACDDLARVVRQVSKGRFDNETAAAITDHAEACARCGQNKRLHVTPAALFAAIPSVDADASLHEDVAASLSSSGVPAIEPEPGGPTDDSGAADAATAAVPGAGAASRRAPVKRRQIGALVGGAIIAIALLLLGLQPWRSSGEPRFGVFGNSSATTAPPRSHATTTTSPPSRSTGATTTTSTTAASNLTAPPATSSTTTTNPTTSPPTTRAPSTTHGSTLPAFVAASVANSGACADGTSSAVNVSWQVRDATSVAIHGPSTDAIDKPPNGQLAVCVATLPATFTLTAQGPGGTASETLTVDGSQPTTSTTDTTTSTTSGATGTTGGNASVPGRVTPNTGHSPHSQGPPNKGH